MSDTSSTSTLSSDHATALQKIDSVVARFFAAFDNRNGLMPQLDSLHSLCIAQVVIIKNSGSATEIYTLPDFIAPRGVLLSDGTLTDFFETEICSRTQVCGRIAQRLSVYRKSGLLAGQPFVTKGIKTIQFVCVDGGWKISAMAWDDEREGFSIKELNHYFVEQVPE